MSRLAWLPLIAILAGPASHGSQAGGYPHEFLFGAWVGGNFPPPTTLTARECLASPTVIFTKDVVMRANPFDATYSQSLVETVRDTGGGVEFRLVQVGRTTSAPSGPFGPSVWPGLHADGFGCGGPSILRVQRRGEQEITFPNCTAFPYPLVRCATR